MLQCRTLERTYLLVSLIKSSKMKSWNPSRRELQVLDKICEGLTAKEIGSELFISQGTVESHKRNLILKFDAKNTVDLAVKAVRSGLC